MRLGDLDALKDALNYGISDAPIYIQATVDQYIDEAPTIEAVPVVRCRECVYAQKKYGHIECLHGISYRNTYNDPDMFCSYGQRKEAAHDKHPSDPV